MRLALIAVLVWHIPAISAQQAEARAGAVSPPAGASQSPPTEPAGGAGGSEGGTDPRVDQRTQLNLVGRTDSAAGESRRNENVQLTPLDTNILKDLNQRLGTTATLLSEFKPEKSYFSTEYGNAPSAVLHVPAMNRAGLHGKLYETHLNSVLSGRSFFQVGGVKPAHENDYGAELLAPLRGRSSVSIQGSQQKIRGMVNGNVLVPLPEERTPLTTDPSARAFIQRIIDAYPSRPPNRPDIDPRMLNTNSAQRINGSSAGAQFDHSIGQRDRLTYKYLFVYQQVDAFQLVAGQNPDTTTRSHQSRFTWSREWTPLTMTSVSLGFDRIGSLLVAEPNNVGPSFTIGGLQDLGPGQDIPTNRADNQIRQAVQVSHQRGAHSLTAGFDLTRRQFNGLQSDSHRGLVRFSANFGRDAITNLRLGAASLYSSSEGNTSRGFRSFSPSVYFGDTWRSTAGTSVSWGLRYQPSPAPSEVHHRDRLPYGCDCNNFSPYLGLAQTLGGWMGVLRGSYGLHYGSVLPVTYGLVRFAPPENIRRVVQQPDLGSILTGAYGGTAGVGGRLSLYQLDGKLVQPYAHLFGFSWEPRLPGPWRLQAGYVGSRTFKLVQMWYRNRAIVTPTGTTADVDARRPDPRYSEIRYLLNTSRSWFDAARVTLQAPRWRGLSLEVSYWFSKALDLGANYSDTGNIRHQLRNQWEFESHADLKGLTDFDQPHALLLRTSFDTVRPTTQSGLLRVLASNWNLSATALLKTGTPFTLESGSDGPGYGNVDGTAGDRINLLDPAILGNTVGNPDTSALLLPRSAFAYMPRGDLLGNLGRNVFRKGPIRNLNAALARKLPLSGDRALLLKVESVNFFNTAQFAAPGEKLTDGDFGVITNTLNDGRTFRFGLSLEF